MSPAAPRRPVPENLIAFVWKIVATALPAMVATVVTIPTGASAVPSQQRPSSSVAATATTATTARRASSPAVSSVTVPSTVTGPTTAPSTEAAPTTDSAPRASAGAPTLVDEGGVQPFPAPLVGPVPAAEVPVERLMTNVYVTASTDRARPQVVVQFRSPFALPERPYRVSVLVGDPGGARLRASLLGNGAGVVTWKAEKSPAPPAGAPWNVAPVWTTVESSDDEATFSPSGYAVVAVPLGQAPEGASVWAEVETGTDGRQVSVSPYYSRAATFDEVAPGQLPSTLMGTISNADGTASGQFVALPAGPVIQLADQAIQVRTTERPPETIAGSKVEKAFDFVRIAPSFNKRAVVTDYVFIDRFSGEIKLLDGFTVPPTDKTTAASWITAGLPAGDPGAATTLQFDLKGVSQALGIQMSPSVTGFGLRREYVLADGRHVVGEAILGTAGWFGAEQVAGLDKAALPEPPPMGPVADAGVGDGSSNWQTMGALLGSAAVLVLACLVVVLRRRRRKSRGDAADELDALADQNEQHRAIRREVRRVTGQVPVVKIVDPQVEPEPEPAPIHVMAALADRHATAHGGPDVPRVPAPDSTASNVDGEVRDEDTDRDVTVGEVAGDGIAEAVAETELASPTDHHVTAGQESTVGSARRAIDADPIWADDERPDEGEGAVISARTVRRREPIERPQSDDLKLKSTFPDMGQSTTSKLQPIAPGVVSEVVSGPTPESTPASDPEPPSSPETRATTAENKRVAPDDALASLGAEFDELTARLSKLGDTAR